MGGSEKEDVEAEAIEVEALQVPLEESSSESESASLTDDLKSKISSTTDDAESHTPQFDRVGWFQQYYWATRKNIILLSRRPIFLMILVLSSIVSVVLGWLIGRDPDPEDIIKPEYDQCGAIDQLFLEDLDWEERDKIQRTLSEKWRYGGPANLMGIGPMFNAIIVFIMVQGELQANLLGVLRALGLRDSVYWMSWYSTFAALALPNSLLGAITVAIVPGHVYENVYFAGVFASLFLLQLALIPATFFVATVCGSTGRRILVNFVLLIILVSAFIPNAILSAQSYIYDGESSPAGSAGLFWNYRNTGDTIVSIDYTYDPVTGNYIRSDPIVNGTCNYPIMSPQQGKFMKTNAQQELVGLDEFFNGCYSQAGFPTTVYGGKGSGFSLPALFLAPIPYFHFLGIWGNFAGYVGMPNRKFTAKEASLSAEELALASLPQELDPDFGLPTTLAPQGSMFNMGLTWKLPNVYDASNCPSPNIEGANLCEYLYTCSFMKEPGAISKSPSTNTIFWYLITLSIAYLLLTAFWAQAILTGNGRRERPWFFLVPSYWIGTKKSTDYDPEAGAEDGVVVKDAKKAFGDFYALKGVSFKMRTSEVTALLGHNGAGKSTLSNILCCEFPATEGDITVFGRSVHDDPHGVRQLVGLCKQDDYLWPTMTAREHLELFAGLRGVTKERMSDTVQQWLESVDLDIVQHQRASQYSGGMKRRLSVALATIGDRPVIVLDEPTTGMDPVSRRFVWRHLDSIRDGRVILLTTHAMEEADLLADEVAIIRKGELAAIGSPLQLKTEHGTALQFSILVGDKDRIGETETFIGNFFAKELAKDFVSVQVSLAGNIIVKILKLQQEDEETEGVPVSSLSEFVSWLDSEDSPVSEYGFSNSSLEEVFLKVTSEDGEELGSQDQAGEPNADSPAGNEDVELANNDVTAFNELSSYRPKLAVVNQTIVIFQDFWVRSWTGRGSIVNYVLFGILIAGSTLGGYGSANSYSPMMFCALYIACLSLILVGVISPAYSDRNEGQFYLMKSQGLLPLSYVFGASGYSVLIHFLYATILLGILSFTDLFKEPEVCFDDYETANFCNWDYSFFGRQQIINPSSYSQYVDVYEGESVEIFAVRSPAGFGMMLGIIVFFAFSAVGAFLASAFLPGYRIPIVFIMIAIVGSSVAPFFAFNLGWKRDELEECYNKTVYPGQCEQVFLPNNNTNSYFLDCIGLDLNSEYLTQYCYPAVAGLLPQFSMYQMLTMIYTAKIKFISQTPGYVENVLIPSMGGDINCKGDTCNFPLAHEVYGKSMFFLFIGGILLCLLGTFMVFLLAFPIGPFLRIRQAITRTARGFFQRSKESSTSQGKKDDDDTELEEVSAERVTVAGLVAPFVRSADYGVQLDHSLIEREDVAPVIAHQLRKVYPAVGGGTPKVALDSLDLHVPRGQVLGLLGKNGAGKTTALKILAGAHDSSGGIGLVAGYDSSLERIKVFERLGNCAQFDCVWSGRTVQWHLEFFAKLKGLPRAKIRDIAQAIAEAVGLGAKEVFQRRAGDLSGGMRRRLSIAMALIGSPAVVILDEPTTGLDPSTRSTIWELIGSFGSNERSMIITTHMMLEADTLCNQIAIVGHGKLKVIGSQQVLKNNYGSGYVLQLNLVKSTNEHQEKAIAFVRAKLHPEATLGIRQAKTLHVNLPRDTRLDKIFRALYSKERVTEGCINQFLLSQSSLEDVFIALGD